MRKLSAGIVILAAAALLVLACGNETAGEGGGGAPATTEPTPAATPEAPPPPAKAEIKCVEDNNKRTTKAGDITRCKLAEDLQIDGYSCKGGLMADFHPGGKLKQCNLATAREVEGFTCKSGLSLYKNGRFRRCQLTADRELNGIQLKARDWVTMSEEGVLYRLELGGGPREIKGFPCRGYMNFFHKNGQLGKCALNEDKTIGDAPHKAGESVCFDEAGTSVECKMLRWNMGW